MTHPPTRSPRCDARWTWRVPSTELPPFYDAHPRPRICADSQQGRSVLARPPAREARHFFGGLCGWAGACANARSDGCARDRRGAWGGYAPFVGSTITTHSQFVKIKNGPYKASGLSMLPVVSVLVGCLGLILYGFGYRKTTPLGVVLFLLCYSIVTIVSQNLRAFNPFLVAWLRCLGW
jgi:hypothetical protein